MRKTHIADFLMDNPDLYEEFIDSRGLESDFEKWLEIRYQQECSLIKQNGEPHD